MRTPINRLTNTGEEVTAQDQFMLPILTCLVMARKPSTRASQKTRAQEGSEDYNIPVGMDPAIPSKSHLAKPNPQTEMCAETPRGCSAANFTSSPHFGSSPAPLLSLEFLVLETLT